MNEQMPCRISDGPQTPEDVPGYEEVDEDEAYELMRQNQIDDRAEARREEQAAKEDYDPTPWCHWCGAMEQSDCDCGPIAANH